MRRQLAVTGLVLASIVACNTGTDDDASAVATSPLESPINIQAFSTPADAPLCSLAMKSVLVYIKSENKIYYCDGVKYQSINLTGAPGTNGVSWIVMTVNAGLSLCPFGGVVVVAGPDANNDKVIDTVTSSQAICNGAPGPKGDTGAQGPAGTNGTNGTNGADGADGKDGKDGANGADGADGAQGPSGDAGAAGASVAIRTVPFSSSTTCPQGGVRVETGVDANKNGTLEDGEVSSSAEVCNGQSGGCTTQAQACQGYECGKRSNGCNIDWDCGTCATGNFCNTNNHCETCSTQATLCAGKTCGSVTNECGQTFTCGSGTCAKNPDGTPSEQCVSGQCQSCTYIPRATACSNACRLQSDGCGGHYDCGCCWVCTAPTCFVAGTPVTMADGSTKSIDKIEVGEEVLALDVATGASHSRKVLETFHHGAKENRDGFVVVNGTLRATGNHPFYVNGQWVRADHLNAGDQLITIKGMNVSSVSSAMNRIETVERFSNEEPTFNIEVDVDHTYFAGGVLVHNIKPPDAEEVCTCR